MSMQGNLERRKDKADPQSNVFGSLLTTFGSVEVGGRNFFKLMQNGECVLLYPGGVREVGPLLHSCYPCLLFCVLSVAGSGAFSIPMLECSGLWLLQKVVCGCCSAYSLLSRQATVILRQCFLCNKVQQLQSLSGEIDSGYV